MERLNIVGVEGFVMFSYKLHGFKVTGLYQMDQGVTGLRRKEELSDSIWTGRSIFEQKVIPTLRLVV